MPFLPDPALRFSHPANRGVVSFLRCQAVREATEHALSDRSDCSDSPDKLVPPPTTDGFLLHTHPELCQRLWEACAGLPTNDNLVPCESFVYGVALLAVRGIIFALAFGAAPGDDRLAVRLAASDANAAYRAGAEPDMGLGDDWLCLDPWQPARLDQATQDCLAGWLERAYENALALPERPFG